MHLFTFLETLQWLNRKGKYLGHKIINILGKKSPKLYLPPKFLVEAWSVLKRGIIDENAHVTRLHLFWWRWVFILRFYCFFEKLALLQILFLLAEEWVFKCLHFRTSHRSGILFSNTRCMNKVLYIQPGRINYFFKYANEILVVVVSYYL